MAGDLVFLTGASGYLGYLTLIGLLRAGYNVRAAARSQSKIDKVLAAPSLRALRPTAEQLSWVIVPDMTADKAYDEAVKGVKYVVHVASPIPSFGDESKATPPEDFPQHFIKTPVKSDIGMLESAHRAGTVRRIVVTSSVVAITPFDYYLGKGDPSTKFTAASRIANAPGPYGFEFEAYSAGKAAALNGMEAWVAAQKPAFDLITVVPGWIFGRDELITDAAGLTKGSTNSVLVGLLRGGQNDLPYNGNVVWGEDCALVHVRALSADVKGNRSFIASTSATWESALDVLKEDFSGAVASGKLSTSGNQGTLDIDVDGSETEQTFGFKFKPFEEIVKQVAGQYLELEAKA